VDKTVIFVGEVSKENKVTCYYFYHHSIFSGRQLVYI